MNSKTVLIDEEKMLQIDYMSNYQSEYICIFTITATHVSTVYLQYLCLEIAHLPKRKLLRWLLEHMTSAQLIRSFDLSGEKK